MLCGIVGSTDFPQFWMESDHFVRSATDRLFKICVIYLLLHLKKLAIQFGLMWNFMVSRSSTSLRCNRYSRLRSSYRKKILRTSSSIIFGFDWYIRFNWVVSGKRQDVDKVKITYLCGSHMNTCDPSNVNQLVMARTRASSDKKCIDQVLSEIVIRMGSSYNIDIQSMIDIFRKSLPERKDVDHHMVYNFRLRALRCKLELEVANMEEAVNHFDASFITDYKATSNNYSIGK